MTATVLLGTVKTEIVRYMEITTQVLQGAGISWRVNWKDERSVKKESRQMKAKIIEISGKFYMTVGGVIQYECDEKGNRKE